MALVGGATGLIGDPSFKASERTLNSAETVQGWVASLSAQISALLPASDGLAAPLLVNNADWMGQMSALDFLRDIGKHFSVNAMLARESVRQRLARPDQGISFTEFSYAPAAIPGLRRAQPAPRLHPADRRQRPVGQHHQRHGPHQAAASGPGLWHDAAAHHQGRWHQVRQDRGGAIWLDPALTSPYAFYQFWLGTADEDVYRFLRYYSFMPLAEIETLEAEDAKRQGRKLAQQVLADELTELVHGRGAGGGAAHQRIVVQWRGSAPWGERSGPAGARWHAKQPIKGKRIW